MGIKSHLSLDLKDNIPSKEELKEGFERFLFSPTMPFVFLAVLLLPFGHLLYKAHYKFRDLDDKRERVERLHARASKALLDKAVRDQFAKKYKNADRHYLTKVIEPLIFLEDETKALSKLKATAAFENWDNIAKRLQFLEGEKNRLKFSETVRRKNPYIEESEYRSLATVEIDLSDLKRLLSLIEEDNATRPELVIKNFKLGKSKTFSSREVYKLKLDVIKRDLSDET